MKFLCTTLLVLACGLSSNAKAYENCTTQNNHATNARVSFNIESDGGNLEAVVVFAVGKAFTFYPKKQFFVLDKSASQSPGFNKILVSKNEISVFQSYDSGHGEWIKYSCE